MEEVTVQVEGAPPVADAAPERTLEERILELVDSRLALFGEQLSALREEVRATGEKVDLIRLDVDRVLDDLAYGMDAAIAALAEDDEDAEAEAVAAAAEVAAVVAEAAAEPVAEVVEEPSEDGAVVVEVPATLPEKDAEKPKPVKKLPWMKS